MVGRRGRRRRRVTRRPAWRVSIARWASDAVARRARSIGPSSVSAVGSIGTRMRANAAAVSDQPHERYCASSPAVAIMPLTALEPPTPRPAYERFGERQAGGGGGVEEAGTAAGVVRRARTGLDDDDVLTGLGQAGGDDAPGAACSDDDPTHVRSVTAPRSHRRARRHTSSRGDSFGRPARWAASL